MAYWTDTCFTASCQFETNSSHGCGCAAGLGAEAASLETPLCSEGPARSTTAVTACWCSARAPQRLNPGCKQPAKQSEKGTADGPFIGAGPLQPPARFSRHLFSWPNTTTDTRQTEPEQTKAGICSCSKHLRGQAKTIPYFL